MADRDPQTGRRSGDARFPASLWPPAKRPCRPHDRTEAVDQLRRYYPSALIDEVTGARTRTVLVSDLGRSPDEFLVDRRGQVIDPAFVVPDQSASIEAGVPEAELIRGRHDAEDPNSGSS